MMKQIFIILILFCSSLYALNLPDADIPGCVKSGNVYNCAGNLSYNNNLTINLSSDVIVNIGGNFSVNNNFQVNSNGHQLFLIAGGSISINNNLNYTGDMTAGGNISINNNGIVNGNLTAGGSLSIGTTVVNGSCTPHHSQCGASLPPVVECGISIGESTTNTANGNILSLNVPNGVVSNDLLVAQVAIRNTGNINPPSGWSLLRSDSHRDCTGWINIFGICILFGGWIEVRQSTFYRFVDGSEPSSYSWNFSSSRAVGSISAYRGVDLDQPIDAHGANTGRSSTLTAPSVNTSVDNTLFLGIFASAHGDSDVGIQSPLQSLNARRTGSGSDGVAIAIGTQEIASSGATGTRHANASNNSYVAQSVALRPAPCEIQPILDYRFDECEWNAVGDVRDTVGTYHGTSFNAEISTDAKLNRSAYFDGSSYIEVGDIEALRNTATLSFWIKTTQVGSSNPWDAPGLIGVEERGGQDDIFWGYLDGNGRIGLSVGNSFITTNSSINNNTYHHIVISRNKDTGVAKIYLNGVLHNTQTLPQGTIGNTFSRLGEIKDSYSSVGVIAYIDELKVFDTVLSDSKVLEIYNNENAGKNWDAEVRSSVDCTDPSNECSEFNIYNNSSNDALITQIVARDFDVSIEFDCVEDNLNDVVIEKLWLMDESCNAIEELSNEPKTLQENSTVVYDGLNVKSAYQRVKIGLQPQGEPIWCESDRFAIRPDRFEIENSTLYAGEYLIITAFDSDDDPTQGFNYTYDKDHLLDYTLGSCAEVFPNVITFVDGRAEIKIDEVIQNLNLIVREEDGFEFASIDAPYNDRFIEEDSTTITVKPHNFVVSNIDFEPLDNWLYMAGLDVMSVDVDVTITARNESNATTTNFDANCYSEGINTIVKYGYDGDDSVELVSRVDSDVAVTLENNIFEIELPIDMFANGSGSKAHTIAINKDYANAKNPFLIWLDDIVFDEGIETKAKSYFSAVENTQISNEHNATFYYARVRPVDLTTSKDIDSTDVYIDVYSDAVLMGMERVSLNWYRFDKDSVNEIVEVQFNGNILDNNISFSDAKATVQLNQSAINADSAIISLDIPSYLWHGNKPYDYDGDCSEHPCIYYRYLGGRGTSGVQSGEFKGSGVQRGDSNATQPKGIRIFR